MRLSDRQACQLVEILRATLRISNLESYRSETRKKLYNEIINQQNGKIVELSDLQGRIENEQQKTRTDSPVSPDGN